MGDPFDTDNRWAVCFYVASSLTELMIAQPCNVDHIFNGDHDDDGGVRQADGEARREGSNSQRKV